ncbi:hypothetical protein BGZ76_004660 [Entomortierella beljakovae]|nr:hypothetical protein BGZ76_004660 [Entomortierella beljakovae]
MPKYALHFGYTQEEYAHSTFMAALSSTEIQQSIRTGIFNMYESWRQNEGEKFWASQNSAYRLDVSTEESVGDLIDRSRYFTKRLFQSRTEDKLTGTLQGLGSKRVADQNANAVKDDDTSSVSSSESSHKRVKFLDTEFSSSSSGSDYIESNPSSARSSLNTSDLKYIDHLVGPGTPSSRLFTRDRLIVCKTDISLQLMNARRNNIYNQSEISDVSDLLSLNFIFDENFLRKHLSTNIVDSLHRAEAPTPPAKEMMLVIDCSVFAATHTYQETMKYVRSKVLGNEESLVISILSHYTERPGLWKQISSHPSIAPPLIQNEDSYTQSVVKNIIFGIIGDLDVIDHWSRDPLPTPNGFEETYLPDYFAEFNNLPLLVVEIKKPDAKDDNVNGDNRKLPCMMKIVLDAQLNAGVVAPSVLGLLIKGSQCEVLSISLVSEALYLLQLIGVFELPKNNLQLGLLGPSIGPLMFARDIITKTINSIMAKGNKINSKHDKWRRPSYYVGGNRLLTPKTVTNDKVDDDDEADDQE